MANKRARANSNLNPSIYGLNGKEPGMNPNTYVPCTLSFSPINSITRHCRRSFIEQCRESTMAQLLRAYKCRGMHVFHIRDKSANKRHPSARGKSLYYVSMLFVKSKKTLSYN